MSTIHSLKKASQFVNASLQPVDAHGAKEIPDVLDRSLEDIEQLSKAGLPDPEQDIVGNICISMLTL